MSMFRRRILIGTLARYSVHALSEHEEHAGTLEDPIPFVTPMEIFKDKYYTEYGTTYLCTRDSKSQLSYNLTELVGLYVEKVE